MKSLRLVEVKLFLVGFVVLALGLAFMQMMHVEASSLDVYASCASLPAGAYCDIQTAINAATPGDIVYLHNGAYSVGSTINISKNNFTLQGESESGVILDTSSLASYSFNVGGNSWEAFQDITLQNFTLIGNLSGSTNYGLKITGAKSVQISHVTINNTGRSAIDFNGVNEIDINYVTLTNSARGNGIAFTDSENILVSNISTSGNAWGGMALYSSSYFPGHVGVDSVVLSGSNSFGENTAIYADGAVGAFSNLDFGTYVYEFQSSSTLGFIQYFSSSADVPAALTALVLNGGRASDAFVTYRVNGHKEVYDGMSIQTAINQSALGGTVDVMPGTFVEQVNVNKKVTLNGAGSGSDVSMNSIITYTNAPVLEISGSGLAQADALSVQNLRIRPVNAAGLFVDDGSVVENVVISNVIVEGTGLAQYTNEQEVGLRVNGSGTIRNMWMENSKFTALDYGWYFFMTSGSGSTVSDIEVKNTDFEGNVNKGMYLEKLSNAIFEDVNVTNNGFVYSSAPSGHFWNEKWDAGIDINLKFGSYQNLLFRNLTVKGNAIGIEEGVGIAIKARDDGGTYGANPASLDGVTFENAVITGNERGIRFGEPDKSNASPINVVIRQSEIHSNLLLDGSGAPAGDLLNESMATVDARENWWGTADGPSGGNVDPVSGDIANSLTGGYVGTVTRFSDWLTAAPGSGGSGNSGGNSGGSGSASSGFTLPSTGGGSDSGGGGVFSLPSTGGASAVDVASATSASTVEGNSNFRLPSTGGGFTLPQTGFAAGEVTILPNTEMAYAETEILLSIPAINVEASVVGAPMVDGTWDLRWIGSQVAYLQGTAFPTFVGNTVLTGHVFDATGLPGVFVDLSSLQYGELIDLVAWGNTYHYQVIDANYVEATNMSVLNDDAYDVLTLITCSGFDEASGEYAYRFVVKAVLVDVD